MNPLFRYVFIMLITCYAVAANSVEIERFEIIIKNHKFSPDIIYASKGKLIKLKIINKDPSVEEFESFDLKREKIVPGNSKINVTVGPLKSGIYVFFGEFNMDTAQGKIIVK